MSKALEIAGKALAMTIFFVFAVGLLIDAIFTTLGFFAGFYLVDLKMLRIVIFLLMIISILGGLMAKFYFDRRGQFDRSRLCVYITMGFAILAYLSIQGL